LIKRNIFFFTTKLNMHIMTKRQLLGLIRKIQLKNLITRICLSKHKNDITKYLIKRNIFIINRKLNLFRLFRRELLELIRKI